MVDFLQNFEQQAGHFNPVVLLAPGITAVVIGLCIWLGGVGFRKHLLGVAGAIIGGAIGSFVIGHNIVWALVLAGVGAAIATAFQRAFIGLLTVVLALVVAFVFLAWPLIADMPPQATSSDGSAQEPQTVSQSIKNVTNYAVEFSARARQIGSQMPTHNWMIMLAVMLVAIVVGLFLRRSAAALSCATLGTMLVFAGMIVLLLYKGSSPISGIFRKPLYYGAVFATMAGFGTLEQLILCTYEKRKTTKTQQARQKAGKRGEESRPAKPSWRTS